LLVLGTPVAKRHDKPLQADKYQEEYADGDFCPPGIDSSVKHDKRLNYAQG
jgi:hypothetical protein